MKLKITKRDDAVKKNAKRVRREGSIPAVLYASHKPAESISIDRAEFETVLRHTPKGGLPTIKFILVSEEGKETKALVKDIQYHKTTYNILHMDFEELHDDVAVNVKVPIVCRGTTDCLGVKLGGVIRQVIRHCQVRCLPKDIPASFELNVKKLGLKQSLRISDIAMPNSIRPLSNTDEVAITIAKR